MKRGSLYVFITTLIAIFQIADYYNHLDSPLHIGLFLAGIFILLINLLSVVRHIRNSRRKGL